MSPSEKPIGVALIICDRVITDAQTNEKTLVSIFNRINARKFPCLHPRLAIYTAMTNGNGPVVTQIRCGNEDNEDKTVFEAKGTINFPGPNHVVEASFRINNVTFPKAGLHNIELLCQDELILERRFHVVQIESKESGEQDRGTGQS